MGNASLQTAERDRIGEEVLTNLALTPKRIAPKFFYDAKGSALFDAITTLDEYYVPRVEQKIFHGNRDDICRAVGPGKTVVEPGAGSCAKIRWLLPQLEPAAYVPMDISATHLRVSANELGDEFPDLQVVPRVCDHTAKGAFATALDNRLHAQFHEAPPVFFYPGSSVGNFEPTEAVDFMTRMRRQMDDAGGLLIGVDTKKDPAVLNAAYNDAEGVTADFNLNVLDHLNHLLDGSLDRNKFEHHAFYNEAEGRIEMHLRCIADHSAELAGMQLDFAAGELVHTENSYKYAPEEFIALAQRAGFASSQLWQDERGWFAVLHLVPD